MKKPVLEVGTSIFPSAHLVDPSVPFVAVDSRMGESLGDYEIRKLKSFGVTDVSSFPNIGKYVAKLIGRHRSDFGLIKANAANLPFRDKAMSQTHCSHMLHRFYALDREKFRKMVREIARVTDEKIVITQPTYEYSGNPALQLGPRNGAKLLENLKKAYRYHLEKAGFNVQIYSGWNFDKKEQETYPQPRPRSATKPKGFILIATKK